MNVPATNWAKWAVFPYSRRAVIALLVFATILAPAFFTSATAKSEARQTKMSVPPAPQSSTLATLAKLREAWVQDLHNKQLESILKSYAPDAVFLQPNGDRIAGS